MKKNNKILKLLTVAFMAIGSVSQVCGMDGEDGRGPSAAGCGGGGGCGAADDSSPPARRGDRSVSVGSTASFMGMSGEDYFARKHAEALRDDLARDICVALFGKDDTPWVGARPVEEVLRILSARSGGGDARPTLENLTLHRQCVDAVVLEMVHNFGNPNASRAIWRVCRAAMLLLLDRRTTNSRWLNPIRAVDDRDVVGHLIGRDVGIVSAVLDVFAREERPDLRIFNIDDQGTNIFQLSSMFYGAAAGFPVELLQTRTLERARRVLIPSSMVDIFEVALLNADFSAHVSVDGAALVRGLSHASTTAALIGQERDDARRDLQTVTQERDGARGDLQTARQERDGLTGQLAAAVRERDAARAAAASWWPSIKVGSVAAVFGGGVVYLAARLLSGSR